MTKNQLIGLYMDFCTYKKELKVMVGDIDIMDLVDETTKKYLETKVLDILDELSSSKEE